MGEVYRARDTTLNRVIRCFTNPSPTRSSPSGVGLIAMETTGSRYTVKDWAIGLSAFVVFTLVVLYVFLLTRPAGWNVFQWSLFLLGMVVTAQLVLVARQRRLRSR